MTDEAPLSAGSMSDPVPYGQGVTIMHHEPDEYGFHRAFAVHVPTETGAICVVEVLHNLVRRTYEVEWTDTLLDQYPEAVTATVAQVMLAIRAERETADIGGRDQGVQS